MFSFGLGMGAALPGRAAEGISAGPLYQEFRLTLAPGTRTEALGPFFQLEHQEETSQWAIPPFFCRVQNFGTDSAEFDVLYPLLTYDRFGAEYRFQILQLFSFSGGQTQADFRKDRFTLFPFYFQQRSANTNDNYTAFLPFYGTIKDRLLRDEIHFCLLPLYLQSRKRDIVTDNYLLPFFHLRHGDGLRGWQFWPLIGNEHKEITTRTNRFDDLETVAGHDKFFALWPFYFSTKVGLGTENPETTHALLPLYSLMRSPKRDSSTYLWPFFVFTDDREKKYHEFATPWPLILFARGEGKTANRVWPLFGHSHNSANLQSDFYLWPIYKYNRAHATSLNRERTRIFFFLFSDLTEANPQTGDALRRTDLWPIFTAHRDLDGNRRLQIFAPIEPMLPNNKSIERNWSPLWSLWRSEANAKTGAKSQSLLWNLYRSNTTPLEKKCSILFGLIQYQSTPSGQHWRWFYLPATKSPPTTVNPPKS